MAGEARSVVVRLTAETAQYIASMQAAGTLTAGAMTKAEAATMKQSVAIDSLGTKAGKFGLVAAVGLAAAGKAAMDWESQFAGVEKTVDGTASELAELEGELRGLAKTMPATHEEIAGVAEAAGQLGVAREDISEFTETMIQLGETTNLTAQDAATSIAQMANVMGTAPEEIDNVGAALVALGNDGASTEAQILGMAQRIAGAGAQIGLAESDILGIANAAASMGIEVEAGGSAISRVFTELAKATAQGGEDLDAFAEVAGMSAEDFVKAFEEDPASAFASFTEGLNRINESGGDVFTTLDQLGLSDTRVSRALLSMASAGDLLTDSLDLGAESFAENRALIEEYAKRLDTTASKTQLAWNQIKDAGISAGTELLPVIAKVAGTVGDLAEAFGSLPQWVQKSLTGLLGIAAVLGGGVWAASKVIGGITGTREALDSLATTSPRTSRALRGVLRAGLALAALDVIGTVVNEIEKSMDDAVPGVEKMTDALLDLSETKQTSELADEFDDISTAIDRLDSEGIDQVAVAIAKFTDGGGDLGNIVSGLEAISTTLGGQGFRIFQGDDDAEQLREYAALLENLDTALANVADQGSAELAQATFKRLADSQGLSADQQTRLISLLPQYGEALAGIDNDARLAAAGSDGLSGAQGGLAELLGGTGDAAGDTADELDGLADSAGSASAAMDQLSGHLDREQAFRDYADAIRETKKALKDGFDREDEEVIAGIGREIVNITETLAKKPAQQRSALKEAKADLEAFIESNPKAKAEFADLLKYVNRALDDLDNSEANPTVGLDDHEFRGGAAAVQRQTKALNFLKANPDVDLNDAVFQMRFGLTKRDLEWLNGAKATAELYADASGVARGVGLAKSMLRGLDGMTVTTWIATKHKVPEADGGFYQDGVKAYAGGGMNYGQGAHVSRQPMMVTGGANILWGEPETGWEAYISGKPSERERNIAILGMAADRLGVQLLQAQGGLIASTYARGGVSGYLGPDTPSMVFDHWNDIALEVAKDWRREAHQRLREAEKRTEALKEELQTAKEVRDNWDQAIESLSETIQGKLTTDLFGEGMTFTSALDNILESDKRQTAAYIAAVEKLRKSGLNQSAMEALLREMTADQVVAFADSQKLTADQIAELNNTVLGVGFESVMANLEHDFLSAVEFATAEQKLSLAGLDGDALQALIEQASPEQLSDIANNWTQDQIDQFAQLFLQTQHVREQAGLLGGDLVFGERRDAAAVEVAGLREDLKKAQVREKHLEELAEKADKREQRMEDRLEEIRDAVKDVAPALGDELDGKGKKSQRGAGMRG